MKKKKKGEKERRKEEKWEEKVEKQEVAKHNFISFNWVYIFDIDLVT